MADQDRQKLYDIECTFHFVDTDQSKKKHKLRKVQVQKYHVIKDSTELNYNIHSLHLMTLTAAEYKILKMGNTQIGIKVSADSKIIYDKKLKIIGWREIQSDQEVFEVEVKMVNQVVLDKFINSNDFTSASTMDTEEIEYNKTAYEIMSQVIKKAMEKGGGDFRNIYNDSGKMSYVHKGARIPVKYNNLTLFDYIFDKLHPYYLRPYLILDDFHIQEDSNATSYFLIINNICSLSAYRKKNIYKIKNFNLNNYAFKESKPIVDYNLIETTLNSKLILKMPLENKVKVIEPQSQSMNIKKVEQFETVLDKDNFLKLLKARKKLVETKGKLDTYVFKLLDVGDIIFGRVYNFEKKSKYNMLPLVIEYHFIRNQYERFDFNSEVTFAKVKENLI